MFKDDPLGTYHAPKIVIDKLRDELERARFEQRYIIPKNDRSEDGLRQGVRMTMLRGADLPHSGTSSELLGQQYACQDRAIDAIRRMRDRSIADGVRSLERTLEDTYAPPSPQELAQRRVTDAIADAAERRAEAARQLQERLRELPTPSWSKPTF